ncbi:EAL domain-containing protein [Campylobacter sp. VBCF_05 NA6]|uniref:sensor domain-containing phosphodiesterase n=1 Tax=unclassified Campylobacter TaxID=2593542 RepID=UPI0022E9F4F7|nr:MULTISPECIES: sensor domain-containing phosphodiesterase [unclassified Campylobacter]MDA3058265.1 EAL domain-containing protein [Campylobacter sp. VBCF_04 NA7]MDA3059835.1 EAL domain-containing protein [Campylobacter sp. VBCF_05 NA6]
MKKLFSNFNQISKDTINWIIMSIIMIISLSFALSYFISLKNVSDYNAVTRQMTMIYDANTRLNTLFASDKPSRDFSSINENMKVVYNTLDTLGQNPLILDNSFSNDIEYLKTAFAEKIKLIDELGALNSQNSVILHAIEQKYINPNSRYEVVNIFSQITQLNYNNYTEIYAIKEKIKYITPQNLTEQNFLKNANLVLDNLTKLNLIITRNESAINGKFKDLREKFANFNAEFYNSFSEMTMVFTAIFLTFLLITYMVNSDAISKKQKLRPYKALVDRNENAVFLLNHKFQITYANKQVTEMFGYKLDELKGKDIGIIAASEDHAKFEKKLKEESDKIGYFTQQLRLLDKNGAPINSKIKLSKLDEKSKYPHYGVFIKDMRPNEAMQASLAAAEQTLLEQGYVDKMTNFGSELALNERIIKPEIEGYIIYLTIANFDNLRLFYSSDITSQIIKVFARSLDLFLVTEKIPAQPFRMQGDEFCLFYPVHKASKENIDNRIIVANHVRKIIAKFTNQQTKIATKAGDISVTINVVAGVSSNKDNNRATRVFQAVMAMYEAQQKNENLEYYRPNNPIELKYTQNQLMINTIQQAIKTNHVFVLVQPIFDISKSDPNGREYGTQRTNFVPLVYEILIRLIDDSGRVRHPGEFMDVAKQASLYTSLTKIVIEEAFRLIENFPNSKFSINLSFFDIANNEIRALLEEKLAKAKNAKNLFIEILESEEFDDYDSLRKFIATAKNRGCKIAIDDFGSGYSNYYRVLTLDVDFIKIDGALIKDIVADESSRAIVETITAFAKNRNYEIIAEYVENHQISTILESMGIKYMQGFFYSKPMEPSKIAV